MPVTIKDIAKVAGVSHTTVSRALNGNPAISFETTERIQQLARQMGYVPSAVAQSLLSRRTQTIGMVITTIADPFIVQVVEGAEQIAQEAGYSIFLNTSHNNPDQEMAVVETFQRRRVDAIIVTSSRVGSLYSSQLDQIKVPIVLINNQEEGEFLYSVAVDNFQGAQLATEHLLTLGHRRIGYVGAADRPKSNGQRLEGYATAFKQAGLALDPALVISLPANTDLERGRASLETLRTAHATAAFCYNDLTAIGLLLECHQQGIAVPQELSIIGFDDIEPALYTTPTLTTIHQPRFKLGQLAMTMTLKLLDGQEVQDQRLPCNLIVRESTRQYPNP
ncbi:MAG: LacI family transcriptional regulator [Anaerolineae bacterium]|nr:LacI family transcriptional regulator [Anaerolineae bacterium]